MREILLCISGPSGVGKGTLVHELLKRDPSLALSVSCTTRTARKGERNGVDYFFLSDGEFRKEIEAGGFFEYDKHFDHYYGTPKSFVRSEQAQGRSVILEIDVVGALNVKRSEPDGVVTVFILPPSEQELECRLKGRGSDTEEQLILRRARVDFEYSQMKLFDYVIVNDDLERAIGELCEIIQKEKNK